jgi:hypothetical protein
MSTALHLGGTSMQNTIELANAIRAALAEIDQNGDPKKPIISIRKAINKTCGNQALSRSLFLALSSPDDAREWAANILAEAA